MVRFEGLITNVARREIKVRTGTQNTIKCAHYLGAMTFEGTSDIVSSKSWLIRLQRIFYMMRCIDEERLSFIELLLEGNAYHWWMSVLRRYEEHGAAIWVDFQRELTNKLFPIIYQEGKINEFITFLQGFMTVEKFERNFFELLRFASLTALKEREKCRRFERGL